MRKHSYPQAEKFLLSREFFGMKLGLENISQFLGSIGSPQNAYRSIHVAGTNGKGSTCAMIASVLQAQGYRVGLYTSPHLVSFRERVQVNGSPITERAIQSFVDRYRGVLVKKNSRSLK